MQDPIREERWGSPGERFLKALVGEERGNKIMERRTGMTQAQRILARDPNAEVPGYFLTNAENEEWAEGGKWWEVGLERSRQWERDNPVISGGPDPSRAAGQEIGK